MSVCHRLSVQVYALLSVSLLLLLATPAAAAANCEAGVDQQSHAIASIRCGRAPSATFDDAGRLCLGVLEKRRYGLIDPSSGFVCMFARLGHRLTEERMILALAQIHRAYVVAHAPTGDHRAGQSGGAFDIVVGAGAGAPQQVLFGRAPGQQDGQLAVKVILGQGMMLLLLEHVRAAEAAPEVVLLFRTGLRVS